MDETIDNELMYPNDDKQNYTYLKLKFTMEKFGKCFFSQLIIFDKSTQSFMLTIKMTFLLNLQSNIPSLLL